MKPWLALTLLALAPSPALADGRDDFVREWPVQLQEPGAGAHRIELGAAQYRSASLPSLRDLVVFDAQGRAVPAEVIAASENADGPVESRLLPWFPLPGGDAEQARTIAIVSERDDDGRMRRLEARLSDAAGAGVRVQPATAWLVDTRDAGGRIVALTLGLADAQPPVDARYRIDGSDDLRVWTPLQADLPVLVLAQDGRTLRRVRLPVAGAARYLRVVPEGRSGVLLVQSIAAEVDVEADPRDGSWLDLQGTAATATRADDGFDGTVYDFVLDGRFPVDRVDVATVGDDAGEWRLWSRGSGDSGGAWTPRAGPWIAYRLGTDDAGERSRPQALDGPLRDRHWRLVPSSPTQAAPTLRLGYRPESVVFVAAGTPPYALAAGSARSQRDPAPIAGLLEAIRERRGASWVPAPATLGPERTLAGEPALQPRPPA
ncbi:MAG TPA: DUF3999 family protein, partial [Luteimonas sp.]|nr:DUF3999 family protein [Luteimonas sp.]